jgi:phosphatidate cytidylyltransferase
LKNLVIRTLTGTLYLLVFVLALIAGKYTFAVLFLIISQIALWEFYHLAVVKGHQPMKYPGMFMGGSMFLLVFFICLLHWSMTVVLFMIPFIVLIFIMELYRNHSNPMSNISITLLGVFYISLPVTLFNKLAFYVNQEYHYHIILGFFILLWINDVFAYVFGMAFGKHKLMERISPKKSWEGFTGGTVMTLIAAYFIGIPYFLLNRIDWIFIGVIISVAGVFGDLTESLFKRAASIKDSGKMLPGHGGMLDRIDSVLFSGPLVFAYLMLINLL